MNTKKIAVLGGTALIAALLLWMVFRCGSSSEEAGKGFRQAATVKQRASRQVGEHPASDVGSTAAEEDGSRGVPVRTRSVSAADEKFKPGSASQGSDTAAAERREGRIRQWDALVDRIAGLDTVTLETGKELKRALDNLDPEDKMPAIKDALNLVPDKGFAVFVPLLFDKQQPEEILDAVFNDMLNRDESIKVPLMKELSKDKTHPMFFESARILDATGVE